MVFRTILVLTLAASLFGCGGKVVVDAEGTGGAGGESGSSSSASSSSSSSSSTSSGMSSADCELFCASLEEGACPKGADCIDRCSQAVARGCVDALSDFMSCIPPFVDSNCLIFYPVEGNPCDPQIGGYESCMMEQSSTLLSSCNSVVTSLVDTNSCKGEASCGIGDLLVECTGDGECACTIAGKLVGNCKALINGVELCSIATSCCSTFFNHF